MPLLLLVCFTLLLPPSLTAQQRPTTDGPSDPPARNWYHQLGGSVGWARNGNNDFGPAVALGIGAYYHHLRQFGGLVAGAGMGFELMNADREERLASLTALAEYQLGKRALRPLLRLSGGVALPVGSPGQSLDSRRAGALLHPSVGLLLLPPSGQWGAMVLDLGYRFTRVDFAAADNRGGSFEREVSYRRLTLGIATRF
ncbi:opacity protein-like surface antigen [Lewinella marina]|uniref:Outer membrane protein beta-barrel domain-containing protein n=1 Tax=Neolewinella marina TaxID=438751 RepID=A0A2G0CIU1_9BACT|nr:hypothetical protein [Neolewinella marina]NJB84953.1 opacity protein-like surface antigen [Neolewinella marina]PHK99894.1 hypothetical protein CGL56_02290 [Neolewinella marina]